MPDDELGLDSFNIINYTSEPPPLISEASLCGNMSMTDASMSVASPLSVSSQLSPPVMAPPVQKQTSVLQHHLLEAEAQIRIKKVTSMQPINTVKVPLRPPRAPRPLQPHLHSQLAQHLTAPLSPQPAPAVHQPLMTEVLLQSKPPQQLQVTNKQPLQQKVIMQQVAQVTPTPLQPATVPHQVIINTQSTANPVNLQQLQQVLSVFVASFKISVSTTSFRTQIKLPNTDKAT